MSDEAVCERIKMALAEAGYPGAVVVKNEYRRLSWMNFAEYLAFHLHAYAAWWAANELVLPVYEDGRAHPCWLCFSTGQGVDCARGDCSYPASPRWPPTELLRHPEIYTHGGHTYVL